MRNRSICAGAVLACCFSTAGILWWIVQTHTTLLLEWDVESRGGAFVEDDSGHAPIVINLYQTDITDAWIEQWAEALGQIKRFALVMDGTKVSDKGLAHLSGSKSVVTLSLNETGVTDRGLGAITSLSRLRSLGIAGTRVSADGLPQLSQLPVVSLEIDAGQLGPASVASLSGMTSLNYLAVQNCSNRTSELVASLPISTVRLQGVGVTDESLTILASMENLRQVMLIGTAVTQEAVKNFSSQVGFQPLLMTDQEFEQGRVYELQ